MSDVIVDENGNVLIPKDILDALNARPGDLLRFSLLTTRAVIIRAMNRSMGDIGGMLYREGQPLIPIEQLSP